MSATTPTPAGPNARARGVCGCGAVRFRVAERPRAVGLCHCGMCRRFVGGGPFHSFQTERVTFESEGALLWWQSSSWGERGSCACCGASLFWRLRRGAGAWVVSVGAMENATGLALELQIYVDEQPTYYDVAGGERLTGRAFTERVAAQMPTLPRWGMRALLGLQRLRSALAGDGAGARAKDARHGACNCGAVQFALDAAPRALALCHCALCRRLNGGAAGLWASATPRFAPGAPLAWWESSASCARAFCTRCGSPVAKRNISATASDGGAATRDGETAAHEDATAREGVATKHNDATMARNDVMAKRVGATAQRDDGATWEVAVGTLALSQPPPPCTARHADAAPAHLTWLAPTAPAAAHA